MRRLLAALLALVLFAAGCVTAPAGDPARGAAPGYLGAATLDVPNADALRRRIWVPGLDEGYVPQGLASAPGGVLYVSAYRPMPDLKANGGPCRVFRVDAGSGAVTGRFDVPPGACTHAGGLVLAGPGRLLLADTRRLFLIDLARALASGGTEGAARTLKLGGALRGAYAAFDGRDPWIGTWTREPGAARMYRLPASLFDTLDGQTISEAQALESLPVPLEAQGAAFDREGGLWLSASNGRWARLYRLDRQGQVQAGYPMVPGLEGLAVDEAGRLWSLSESGARKYLHWAVRFPFVFQIDTARLRAAP
ncbi:hypothetical protein [Ottowia sp.]|uniref:hypothetical protein n=1 Tax=Ottowia sp. TaxID=1898956 RepID=UPI0039E36F28